MQETGIRDVYLKSRLTAPFVLIREAVLHPNSYTRLHKTWLVTEPPAGTSGSSPKPPAVPGDRRGADPRCAECGGPC